GSAAGPRLYRPIASRPPSRVGRVSSELVTFGVNILHNKSAHRSKSTGRSRKCSWISASIRRPSLLDGSCCFFVLYESVLGACKRWYEPELTQFAQAGGQPGPNRWSSWRAASHFRGTVGTSNNVKVAR